MIKFAAANDDILTFSNVLFLFKCTLNVQYETKHTSDFAGCLVNCNKLWTTANYHTQICKHQRI